MELATMYTEPAVHFPVTCPKCRREVLSTLPIASVAAALISERPVRLYASCHDVYWDAHPSEIEQLREYMSAARVGSPPSSRAGDENETA
jgi:hypothetical protein